MTLVNNDEKIQEELRQLLDYWVNEEDSDEETTDKNLNRYIFINYKDI